MTTETRDPFAPVAKTLEDGRVVEVPAYCAEDFVGVSDTGLRIFRWPDGPADWLIGITRCCGAASSIDEGGTMYCKACYEECEPELGGNMAEDLAVRVRGEAT